jgi:hypothetical protein
VFYVSLVLSSVLFVVTTLAVWLASNRKKAYGLCWLGLALGIAPVCIGIGFPTYLLHALLVAIIATACLVTHRGAGTFLVGSILAFAGSYGTLGVLTMQRSSALRDKYPVENLAPRLAYEAHAPAERRIVLNFSEDYFADREDPFKNSRHSAETLRKLHEDYVALFAQSSGFGVARMSDPTMWLRMESQRERRLPVPQSPQQESDLSSDAAESLPAEIGTPSMSLHRMHRNAVVDFIDPGLFGTQRFGYLKSREYTIGFRPHQFESYPGLDSSRMTLCQLSLVSLLKHAEPRVYVSDHLPRMDDLRDAPTRTLDRFEREGLDRLRGGQDLAAAEGPDRIRLLGAIVAGKTCVGCHAVEQGTLLGAFSYDLRRDVRGGP